jgi:hypothetical protein
VVNRTGSVKIGCLQKKWIIAYWCEWKGKAPENQLELAAERMGIMILSSSSPEIVMWH